MNEKFTKAPPHGQSLSSWCLTEGIREGPSEDSGIDVPLWRNPVTKFDVPYNTESISKSLWSYLFRCPSFSNVSLDLTFLVFMRCVVWDLVTSSCRVLSCPVEDGAPCVEAYTPRVGSERRDDGETRRTFQLPHPFRHWHKREVGEVRLVTRRVVEGEKDEEEIGRTGRFCFCRP